MKNSTKSKVMKAAWTIFRKYAKKTMANWSKALKKAWAWAKKKNQENSDVSGFEIIRETAKAVCVRGFLICTSTDQSRRADMWVPKSLINNNAIAGWFFNKKVAELKAESSYIGSLSFSFDGLEIIG